MFKKVFFILIASVFLIGLSANAVFAQESKPERPWDFSIELNQMLHFQLDVEYFFNDSFGLKGGLGLSPIGITCITYNTVFVYHLNLPSEHFQLDIEAGLPIAYFDVFEGAYVDWDPIIDDPYFGFLPGASLLISYRFNEEQALGIRAGAAAMIENQRDTGWKGPYPMPIIAIIYNL